MWSRRYVCDVGTEMASVVGEDRGWGMSEAVPSQVFAHPYSKYTCTCIYRARLCQQLGFRSGWIIRQRLTSTLEPKKRLFVHLPQR